VGKLRVGGGFEKIVKKWLIFEIILGIPLPVFNFERKLQLLAQQIFYDV
jgi:hypothetical protein